MSDRDKKLIIIVFILAVGLLPYFFYIKDKRVETEAIANEIVELEARLAELQAMDANRAMYEAETKKFKEMTAAIVAEYPADVYQPNYIMFLLGTEYSSLKYDEVEDKTVWEFPIRFNYYDWIDNIETPISAEDVEIEGTTISSIESVDTGLTGLTNLSKIQYACHYDALKYILDYFKEYKDPMIYKEMTMKFDEKTGEIDGEIILAQYAIAGEGRELPAVDFTPEIDGQEMMWSIDGVEGDDEHPSIRGNQEVGVFGPFDLESSEDEEGEDNGEEGNLEEGDESSEENSDQNDDSQDENNEDVE